MNDLFADFEDLGWNEDSKILLLSNFIIEKGLQEEFSKFLEDQAADETSGARR